MSQSLISSLFGAPQANNPLDDRYYDSSGSGRATSGTYVDPDVAMSVSAVYRCVAILANSLAVFGMGMFERLERGRREAPDHPLDSIISFKPNSRQSAFEFWRLICFHLVLRQNAYAQIIPGKPGRGWVGELIPLHPDRITGPEELADGRLRYEYQRPDGRKVKLIGGTDIWHLQGLSQDGLRGLSMLDVARDTIGLSLAAERHQSRFFDRGVKATGVLQSDRTLKPETAREMGESFGRAYGGEAGQGKTPVLWDGVKFLPISLNLKDQEFLDSRKFSVTEIARWFGLPPHLIADVSGSTSWGSGIAEQNLAFLIFSLQPWITLLEQSVWFTLVVQPEKYYPKMNPGKLLRMNAESQARVFATLIDKGVLSPNECRELLERNPRDGGDEYVDVTKTPANPTPTPLKAAPDPNDEEPDEEEMDMAAQAVIKARTLANARALELLAEEEKTVSGLAKRFAKSSSTWRSAVSSFYGEFSARVALAMVCERQAARAWCEHRRDRVFADGLLGLNEEAVTTLADLSLVEGIHVAG